MNKNFDHKHWDSVKIKLLKLYPVLTTSDLIWRHGTVDELLETISCRLGKSKNELIAELDAL
jgi:hypothetical protein